MKKKFTTLFMIVALIVTAGALFLTGCGGSDKKGATTVAGIDFDNSMAYMEYTLHPSDTLFIAMAAE